MRLTLLSTRYSAAFFLQAARGVYGKFMRFFVLAVKAGLAAAANAQTAPSPLHLIPMPREVTFKGDQPIAGVTVECPNCGPEDQFAAGDLRDELSSRGIPSGNGLRIVLQRLGQHPDTSFTAEMQP